MTLRIKLTKQEKNTIKKEGKLAFDDFGTKTSYILLPVRFTPDKKFGGLTAYVEGMPGCGVGESKKEALSSLTEAIEVLLEAKRKKR